MRKRNIGTSISVTSAIKLSIWTEKADYGKAVNDIKNVFDRLRIQNQKIQEAMGKIRHNALSYSVEEYREMIEENISTIEKTRQEFKVHREVVNNRVREFEEQEINVRTLSGKDRESLDNLRIVEGYLGRALEEHQNILSQHFDLKSLYDMELENYSNMRQGMQYIQSLHKKGEDFKLMRTTQFQVEQVDSIIR